jgi:hypothetical protein
MFMNFFSCIFISLVSSFFTFIIITCFLFFNMRDFI